MPPRKLDSRQKAFRHDNFSPFKPNYRGQKKCASARFELIAN
tara:strand:+ start:1387 stop:1512 length:126 start_codon:yes stop_codon:yes gene_type:complete